MTARAHPRLYPCNRGIPGPGIGYHESAVPSPERDQRPYANHPTSR